MLAYLDSILSMHLPSSDFGSSAICPSVSGRDPVSSFVFDEPLRPPRGESLRRDIDGPLRPPRGEPLRRDIGSALVRSAHHGLVRSSSLPNS